jgi:hypothetical protein
VVIPFSHRCDTLFTPPHPCVFCPSRYPLVPARPGGEGGLTWSTAYVRPPNRCVGPARWRRSRCGAPSWPCCSDKSPNSLITKLAVEAMVTEDATSRPIATSGAALGGANRWRQPNRLLARLGRSRAARRRRFSSMMEGSPREVVVDLFPSVGRWHSPGRTRLHRACRGRQ